VSAAFLDVEVAELLRESPELLAVADAIAATQAPDRRAGGRPWFVRSAAVAAVLVVAATAALVLPWQGRGSGFVAKALAALGDGQVIHVVSVSELPNTEIMDVQSGASSPVESKTEIWFDGTRSLERVVSSVAGATMGEVLQTPAGSWSDSGPVYTCAWIAAHPVQATKAHVSCNASGVNGTTPRRIPEPLPNLDPALAGFVSGYQDALQSGLATRDGAGVIDGRQVEWLRFSLVDRGPPGASDTARGERVAVDAQTLKPLLVETSIDGQMGRAEIAAIETLAPQDVTFARPKETSPSERPVATSVKSERTTSLADASAALGGHLLWSGAMVDGLSFTEATVQQIVTGYGASSGVPVTHSTGVELVYGGPTTWNSSADYVVLRQSPRPEMLYGFARPGMPPTDGRLRVESSDVLAATKAGKAVPTGKTLWRGCLVKDGVYVSIEATSKALLVDAARQLEAK
jgi:hypothetical protein